jgi:hypothetical protein
MATTLSPAGAMLFGNNSVTSLGSQESEAERKKRLQALQSAQQAAQAKLSTSPGSFSPAGIALGLGGYTI